MSGDLQSDDARMDAVAKGDADAFRSVVEEHQAMVYRTCLRILRNAADAKDATQATFIVLHKKCGQLKRGTVLGGWLYRTAGFVSREFIRSAVRRKRREEEASVMGETNEQDHSEMWNSMQPVLDGALMMLPEKYREVVVLRYLEGKSTNETADVLGMSSSVVTTRLARALDHLRTVFKSRGIAMGSGALAALLAENASAASVPSSLTPSILAAAGGGTSATAASANVGLMVNGVLAKMGWIANCLLKVYIFLSWIACMFIWFSDGCPIPRWVHILSGCLLAAGVGLTIFMAVDGMLTVRLALAFTLIPPVAAYVGWLWMCGPAFAKKDE